VSPWQELLAGAERELALAREGRWEELAAAGAERNRVAAAMPAPVPAVRGILERLALVQEQLTALTNAARAETARELGTLNRGRGAVRGYGRAGRHPGARGGWVDEAH
jgi:hypothetical protein